LTQICLAPAEKDHKSKQDMDLVFTDQLLKNLKNHTNKTHASYDVCSESGR